MEAGGHELLGSVNHERQLTRSPGLGVLIGLGFYAENVFYLTIPAGINYLFKLPEKNLLSMPASVVHGQNRMVVYWAMHRLRWKKTTLISYPALVTEGILPMI